MSKDSNCNHLKIFESSHIKIHPNTVNLKTEANNINNIFNDLINTNSTIPDIILRNIKRNIPANLLPITQTQTQ